MSAGLTPAEFVQQVYYVQEKVLLNWEPCNDKYQEVLMEGNLVLQELEKAEDWLWLRETRILGETGGWDDNKNRVLELDVPEGVLKPSRLYQDSVRLHFKKRDGSLNERAYIIVPWKSAGYLHSYHTIQSYAGMPDINVGVQGIGVVMVKDKIVFTRPLYGREFNKIVASEWQVPIEKFDMYNVEHEYNYEHKLLTEIPDPNYVVWMTAARHAAGSPPVADRVMEIEQAAQRILSGMRQDNAEATYPDFIEGDYPTILEIT